MSVAEQKLEYFLPYEGRKPYLFISYAHKNSAKVLPVIRLIHEQKYRLWYDEGISAGGDWPTNIDVHMRACAAVVFFISASSVASLNCLNEIEAAAAQGKPILCLRFDDTPLPPNWEKLLAGAATADVGAAPEQTAESILGSGFVTREFLGDGTNDPGGVSGGGGNGWLAAVILGILLLIAAGVGAYGLSNGWFNSFLPSSAPVFTATPAPTPSPVPTAAPTINIAGWESYASFPDTQQEKAIRSAIGQSEGEVQMFDLKAVTELHFCGNMTRKDETGIAYAGDGVYTVNGAPVVRGKISDLSLLSELVMLKKLTLVQQNLTKLSPLKTLILLTTLNVADNPITDVDGMEGMVSLETLHLERTNVQDLTPLGILPALKTVTVSAEIFPLTLDPNAGYDVVLVP